MKKFLLVLLYFISYFALYAQSTPFDRPVRRYYTQIMNQGLNVADTSFGKTQRGQEKEIFENRTFLKVEKIDVPIVVHVLYTPGTTYPSEQQIWWQLENLNKDFAVANYQADHPADDLEKFSEKIADTEISFCIPRAIITSKKQYTGISFVETKTKQWGANWDMCSSQSGGSDPVDPDRYLNIWVVNLADSISGWATYSSVPVWGKGKADWKGVDGIIIDYDFFGQDEQLGGTAKAPYNEGKTLTHLVGNYLGLYDLWNDFSLCADDYVDDTPIHNAPNLGCQVYKHVSTCHEQPAEMIMNFMDNSDDACQRMFTLGQKLRMQSMFAPGGPRASLLHTLPLCEKQTPLHLVQERSEADNPIPKTAAKEISLSIWPNPAGEEANVLVKTSGNPMAAISPIDLLIYNAQGQLQARLTGNVAENIFQSHIKTSGWPSGVYWVFAYTPNGVVTNRFSIQQP